MNRFDPGKLDRIPGTAAQTCWSSPKFRVFLHPDDRGEYRILLVICFKTIGKT